MSQKKVKLRFVVVVVVVFLLVEVSRKFYF